MLGRRRPRVGARARAARASRSKARRTSTVACIRDGGGPFCHRTCDSVGTARAGERRRRARASARLPPEAWVDASRRESEAWNGRAERERKRARMEEGRIAFQGGGGERARRGRARERVKGGAEAKRERETAEVEAEETSAMRAARKVYDERMERVRRVTRRRATTLSARRRWWWIRRRVR